MKFFRLLAQLLIILAPIGLFVWLLVIDIAPFGSRYERYTVGDKSPFIDRLLPDERVKPVQENADGEPFTQIIDEPVYFSIHFPQTHFEQIELEILFDNKNQKILEVGPLVDVFSQAYDLKPLVNSILEDITWPSLQQEDVILFQREQKFDSIDAFLANTPDRSKIATYHYDIETPYRLANYAPLGKTRSIDVSLRGFHKFVTYVKNEPVQFKVTYMDMNRTTGADDVRVVVRNERGESVFEEILEDDGDIDENQVSSTRTVSFNESGWAEGVYSFELSGTSDIFWRRIDTSLRYVTFVNQIYIGDDVGHLNQPRSTSFFTNAKHFVFETSHADAAQTVKIGTLATEIPFSHEKVRVDIAEPGVLPGSSPLGDIRIAGDGKFAFSEDAFFDPDPVRLSVLTNLDALHVDYIIATYTPPEEEGNWKKQTVRFNTNEMRIVDGSTTFALSAPLIAENKYLADIHAINVRFINDRMTFSDFLLAIRHLLPFGL